jgi:hypothetical protein
LKTSSIVPPSQPVCFFRNSISIKTGLLSETLEKFNTCFSLHLSITDETLFVFLGVIFGTSSPEEKW